MEKKCGGREGTIDLVDGQLICSFHFASLFPSAVNLNDVWRSTDQGRRGGGRRGREGGKRQSSWMEKANNGQGVEKK